MGNASVCQYTTLNRMAEHNYYLMQLTSACATKKLQIRAGAGTPTPHGTLLVLRAAYGPFRPTPPPFKPNPLPWMGADDGRSASHGIALTLESTEE
jgi:hypothetical protein